MWPWSSLSSPTCPGEMQGWYDPISPGPHLARRAVLSFSRDDLPNHRTPLRPARKEGREPGGLPGVIGRRILEEAILRFRQFTARLPRLAVEARVKPASWTNSKMARRIRIGHVGVATASSRNRDSPAEVDSRGPSRRCPGPGAVSGSFGSNQGTCVGSGFRNTCISLGFRT